MMDRNRTTVGLMMWLARLILLLLVVAPSPGLAQTLPPESPTQTVEQTLNPFQAEEKFQMAYTIITQRYIEQIPTNLLLIKGVQRVLLLPELHDLQYSDLITPTQPLGSRRHDFEAFRSVLQTIRMRAAQTVDLGEVVSETIYGMVDALDDEYSAYLEPQKNQELHEFLMGEQQSFGGIGIQYEFKNGRCKVIAPIPNTPAYRAGIRPGDIILEVDGIPIKSVDDASTRMTGEPGSRLELKIERADVYDPIEFALIREMVSQPALEKVLLPGQIGYVRINSFTEQTAEVLLQNLRYLDGLGMEKCLLDLRRNSGGLLDAAIDVSSILLPPGSLVVSTKGRTQLAEKNYRTSRGSDFTRLPLVVLVDEYTASAAEIVTGAVIDNRRGRSVGQTTFGKGTVQEVIQLPDNSALKLTIARYHTPSGRMIDKKGIKPNYSVSSETYLNPAILFRPGEEIDLTKLADDRQVKFALELLGQRIPVVSPYYSRPIRK